MVFLYPQTLTTTMNQSLLKPKHMKKLTICSIAIAVATSSFASTEWETLSCENQPVARHEAGFVEFEGKLYLLGGRRINPVSILDPDTKKWSQGAKPPIEIHHFQPTVYEDAIWVVGAMTGPFPNETPLDRILKYYPKSDTWEWGLEIPKGRRRGGAGVSIDPNTNTLYLSAGITRGHMGGFVSWCEALDLKTGQWTQLPDAPHARDHFQSAIIDGKLYLAGGRQTSRETNEVFSRTIGPVDVLDLSTRTWTSTEAPLPTPRAGNSTFPLNHLLLVVGGETNTQKTAHAEVEGYNSENGKWVTLPSLQRGRHGTGIGEVDGFLYTASGSGNRGGKPELEDTERIETEELLEFIKQLEDSN